MDGTGAVTITAAPKGCKLGVSNSFMLELNLVFPGTTRGDKALELRAAGVHCSESCGRYETIRQ